jgi:hypothetical protein
MSVCVSKDAIPAVFGMGSGFIMKAITESA